MGRQFEQPCQRRHTQLRQTGKAQTHTLGHQHPLRLGIGNHADVLIEDGQLGTRGQAQVTDFRGQVIHRSVHTDNRAPGVAAHRQADTHLSCGKEHVRLGYVHLPRFSHLLIPGPQAGVEPVVGGGTPAVLLK